MWHWEGTLQRRGFLSLGCLYHSHLKFAQLKICQAVRSWTIIWVRSFKFFFNCLTAFQNVQRMRSTALTRNKPFETFIASLLWWKCPGPSGKHVSQGQSCLEMRSKCKSGHHMGPGSSLCALCSISLPPPPHFVSLHWFMLTPSLRVTIIYVSFHSSYYVLVWCQTVGILGHSGYPPGACILGEESD